jgi:soluble lytic murein transglycosylase-like protein
MATINQILAQLKQSQQQNYAPPAPVDRSIVSLLGEAVGGGTTGLSPADREAAGTRALLNFGANLSAASGPSTMPRSFGQIFAQGVGGAEQSLGSSEAVAASRLGAQQAYEEKQQELQIGKIREAIPLLQLQANQRALAGMKPPGTSIATAGAPAANVPPGNYGAGGPGADAKVPDEWIPYYQEASQRTGIPVDVLIAQARQESGFNASATGKAGEIGVHQIKPSTAAEPGFGVRPIDPATLKDPRANINFAADYLKAHLPPGADPKDPAAIRLALKGYNGGGDPNYVANVTRYLPVPAPPAPAAGTTAPAPYKVASTGATAPPASTPPPAPGMPPAATPPPAPDPNTFVYHPSPIPDEFKTLVTGNLTPAQIQNLEVAKAGALQNFKLAQATGDPKSAAAAQDAYNKVLADETTMLGGQTDKARDFLKEFYKNDFEQQKGIFETNQKAQLDRVTQAQKAEAEGRQQRETNAAQVENTASGKLQEQINTESLAAKDRVNDLDGLQVLSDQVGNKSTNLATISIGGQSLLDRLVAAGVGTKEKLAEMGNMQAFQTGVAGLIKSLRQGMSMGSLSDSDLRFVSNMAPTLLENQATRNEIIAYLKEMQQRKLQFGSDVSQLIAGGGPNGTSMKIGQAIQVAQSRMREFAPTLPAEIVASPKDQQMQWAIAHDIRPQQLVRLPDGRLAIFDVEGVLKRGR